MVSYESYATKSEETSVHAKFGKIKQQYARILVENIKKEQIAVLTS